MTGTALTDAIHAVRPDLPVVLCSGHTDAMTTEQAQALGIAALLWKPIQIHELGGAIRRVLEDA
jgi:DNA-binding NtrC family response regulator